MHFIPYPDAIRMIKRQRDFFRQKNKFMFISPIKNDILISLSRITGRKAYAVIRKKLSQGGLK